MNYFAARQRESDKRWDYTCRNDGRVWPVGYCRAYREFSTEDLAIHDEEHAERENAKIRPFREKYHTDGHETADEACACYREYELDHRLKLVKRDGPDTLRQCKAEGCGEWTGHSAEVGLVHFWPLCDEHLTRETVAALMPEVGARWAS